MFRRKSKIDLSQSNNSYDEFDYDFDNGQDYGDDYQPGNDRKPGLRSKIINHYRGKLNSSEERTRLAKASLPSSYSAPVDMGFEIAGDIRDIKHQLDKEWEIQKRPVKKLIQSHQKELSYLKFLGGGKLVDWANQEDRQRDYQEEDQASKDELMVQSLLSGFTNPDMAKAESNLSDTQETIDENEQEDSKKSLAVQIRGTATLHSVLAELKRSNAFQDSVTHLYQRKNLEFNIRNYIESKKQTEILRTYKDEAVSELKEIHKNTGLPEAVKINSSEFTGQIFKEKMVGSLADHFDGKFAPLRKRVALKVRDKLLNLTKDIGTTVSQLNEANESLRESGQGGLLSTLFGDKIGEVLDKPYNLVTSKMSKYVRGKINSSSKLTNLGQALNAYTKVGGSLLNQSLLTGNTGNEGLDKLFEFFELNKAGIKKDDRVRNSLYENLDVAQHMDTKFKQTVERVIPGWLSLLYREVNLIRTGAPETSFKEKTWDWKQEKFVNTEDQREDVFSSVVKKENIEEYSISMERLLRHYDPAAILSNDARDELRKWIQKCIAKSFYPSPYNLLISINSFKKENRKQLTSMCEYTAHLFEDDLLSINSGLLEEGNLINTRKKYRDWVVKAQPLIEDLAKRPLLDLNEVMKAANSDQLEHLKELGIVTQDRAGNISVSDDFNEALINNYGKISYRQKGSLVQDGTITVKQRDGKKIEQPNMVLDEAANPNHDMDEYLHEDIELDRSSKNNQDMQRWVTSEQLEARFRDEQKAKAKNGFKNFSQARSNEIAKGLKDGSISYARGGLVLAGGGDAIDLSEGGETGDEDKPHKEIRAKLHGGEFVTDNVTTKENKKLLAFMNKFKAPVFLPNGDINPVYHKALGLEKEEDLLGAHRNTDLNKNLRNLALEGKGTSLHHAIKGLFEAIDFGLIDEPTMKKLVDGRIPDKKKFTFLMEERARQAKLNQKGTKLSRGISSIRDRAKAASSNTKTKENVKEMIKASKEEANNLFKEVKSTLTGTTEEEAKKLLDKLLAATDPSVLTKEEAGKLKNPKLSTTSKIMLVTRAKIREENRTELGASLIKATGKNVLKLSVSKLKSLVDGGGEDTANSDAIAKAYSDAVTSVKSKASGIKTKAISKARIKEIQTRGFKNATIASDDKSKSSAKIDLFLGSPNKDSKPVLEATKLYSGGYFTLMGKELIPYTNLNQPFTYLYDGDRNLVLTFEDVVGKGLFTRRGSPFNLDWMTDPSLFELNSLDDTVVNQYNRLKNSNAVKAGKEIGDKIATKLRIDKAKEMLGRFLKDEPIDLYHVDTPNVARLTAEGFKNGLYIDKASGVPLISHNDIRGVVVDKLGAVLLTDEEIEKGFLDLEGNPVNISTLKHYRNQAVRTGGEFYNKYAKKHVDKLLDRSSDALLTATEKWQHMFKQTAIDIYVDGRGDLPVLTGVGFKSGLYFSQVTKKPLKGYLDIDGPVMDKFGTILVTKEEIDEKKLKNIKGEEIKPPKLMSKVDRLKSLAYKAFSLDKIASLGKAGIKKIKDFNAKQTASDFAKAGAKAVDVYVNGELKFAAKDFQAGMYVDVASGKKLANHYMITGPVAKINSDSTTTVVLTEDDLKDIKFTDIEGKPLPVVKTDLLRSGIYKGIASGVKNSKILSKIKGKFSKKKPSKDSDEETPEESSEETKDDKKPSLLQRMKKRLTGKITLPSLRSGSWQEKRAKKEEDSWMSRLAGHLRGGADKVKSGASKTKSWAGKMLAAVLGIGGIVVGGIKKVLSWAIGGLFKNILWGGLKWLGRSIAMSVAGKGLMGGGLGGKLLKGVGLAGGAYMAYQGLKGEEKVDEQGNPVLDENGEPVVERSYGTAAAGLGLMALSTGKGLSMAGGALKYAAMGTRIAAGILTGPVGWAALGATAAYYGGKWALGKWRKGKALEENPMMSFRMIQYGFSPTDEKVIEKLLSLEGYLSKFVKINGEDANISNEVDVGTVFSVFEQKYTEGDYNEENKKLLTWFIGRFKPVYLSYVKQMKLLKSKQDISTMDEDLSASDKLKILNGVHFKNQSGGNPYNVMVSPFSDPDECDYTFEDVAEKFEKVKEILKEKVEEEPTKSETGEETKSGEEGSEKESSGPSALRIASSMGIIGATLTGLNYLSKKSGEIFGMTIKDMGTAMSNNLAKMTDFISSKWEDLKSMGKGLLTSVSNAVLGEETTQNIAGAIDSADQAYGNMVDAAGAAISNTGNSILHTVTGGAYGKELGVGVSEGPGVSANRAGVKSVNIKRVIEVGKGYNIVETADGAVIKQTGPWNWRNNNPGNISDGKYAKSLGALDQGKIAAKGAGRFAVFPTYEIGRKAKAALIFTGANYKNLDIHGMLHRYAPPKENNTAQYISRVLAAVGVNKKMSSYTAAEREVILTAMEKMEGYKEGKHQIITPATKASTPAAAASAAPNSPAAVKTTASAATPAAKPALAGGKTVQGMLDANLAKNTGGSTSPGFAHMAGKGPLMPGATNTAAPKATNDPKLSNTATLVVTRFRQSGNSTLSAFQLTGTNVSGYFLEPPGPATTTSGLKRRIPTGTYKLMKHSSKKYPRVVRIYNDQVPAGRAILIHQGNQPSHTEGCLLAGSACANDSVSGSKGKLKELMDALYRLGVEKVPLVIKENYSLNAASAKAATPAGKPAAAPVTKAAPAAAAKAAPVSKVVATPKTATAAKATTASVKAATPATPKATNDPKLSNPVKTTTTGNATAAPATKSTTTNTKLASILSKCTPELVAAGKSHVRFKSKNVTVKGMNDVFMQLFYAMCGEAKAKGLSKIQINDGFRSLAEQKRLYALYKAGKGSLAARPGTSRHGFGMAIDINTVNCNELIKAGIFSKYGFNRPLLKKKETWHVENIYVPKNGAPTPSLGTPNETKEAVESRVANGDTSAAANSNSTGGVTTTTDYGNSATPTVNAGGLASTTNVGGNGYSSTASVATAQSNDIMNSSSVANVLNRQLDVQIQIRDTLVSLKEHIVKSGGAQPDKKGSVASAVDLLKDPKSRVESAEGLGKSIANTIAESLGIKIGERDTFQKPVPPISASK